MGWSISVHVNTLKVPDYIFDELEETADEHGFSIYHREDETIGFDEDAMEHIDFLWQDWALGILSSPEINGDVVFISVEGDDAGEIWGYRFKDGEMTRLRGRIVVEEVE